MVKIEIFCDQADKVLGFQAKGHAMGSDRECEFDLICCAVSVLTISTVNGITDVVGISPQELVVDDGFMRLLLVQQECGTEEERIKEAQTQALLASMVLGLQELVKDYPKFVQLKKRRWTS